MVTPAGISLYKEARLNIELAYPGSAIAFALPANPLSTFGSRPDGKRTVFAEKLIDQDEDAFTRRHLATDGSLFFRQHHSYPRSFLWRVLDNRTVLEIQAVDFDHDFNDKSEANLTLLFQFPLPIRPFCVALAEPTDRDAIVVYAVTTSNELYTLTLHRDFLVSPAASEQDLESWCKKAEPALFSGRTPYRVVAVDVNELLVTLDDGAICRMFWDKSTNSWDGSRYQNSNWSVRGLLSWKAQPTVRFNNVDLSISAAASVALSPDGHHIFSVSLDHTLRAWNIASGKPGANTDLLGTEDRALERGQTSYSISPSQSKLMEIADVIGGVGGAAYHVVTYSPKLHQFKFWGVRDADDALAGLYDAAVGAELVPPIDELMNTTVWTLEEFHVLPGPAGWRNSTIWIRARSGPSSRVFKLDFDLTEDAESLSQCWKHDWVAVDAGPLTVEALKNNPANPASHNLDLAHDIVDLTERWFDFLFYPGRFTTATLETALVIFKRPLNQTQSSRLSSRTSLKDRICSAVAALAAESEDQSGNAIASRWQAYFGLVKDLHKRRGDSLSLVYDGINNMPWLVLSDYVSAVRSCSHFETSKSHATTPTISRRRSNSVRKTLESPGSQGVSQLLNAAASFRRRLPSFVQEEVERHLEVDMLQSRSLTVIDRMEWIEGHSELLQHVSDDDLSLLIEELGTEVKDISTDTFVRAVRTMGFEGIGNPIPRRQLARYGLSALLRVSQETLEAHHNALLDLLVLVLFMFVELEGETPDHFDASQVFFELAKMYKDSMVVSWLARTVWSHQTATGPATEATYRALSENLKVGKQLPITQTVLEGTQAQHAFDVPLPKDPKTNLLTLWGRGWIASIFEDTNYDDVVEDIMGYLMGQKEYRLAKEFSKFLPESSWSTYLKGRLNLVTGDTAQASICFQKPAYNLALGSTFNVEDADTAGLVSEHERNFFSDGLARYYSHVIGLCEKARAFSYVADFARLGLRTLVGGEDEEVKTELLQRLFTASIHTSRFQDAYSAMTRLHDPALQRSNLQTLITTMIAQSRTPELLNFPFATQADDVDSVLLALCQKTLNLAAGPPYHQILYSFRTSRNNFRGAASIMYERLQRLKSTSSKHQDDASLAQCYVLVINTLSSVRKEDAYILAEQKINGPISVPQWGIGQGKKMLKRQIITLDVLRREYQAELDRTAAIESGQFPFVDPVDDMDVL
ncbi:hypothetical protein ACN47E_002491 [Coniothyrium glycines]